MPPKNSWIYFLSAVVSLVLFFSQYFLPDLIEARNLPICAGDIKVLLETQEMIQARGCRAENLQINQKVIAESKIQSSDFSRAQFQGIEIRLSTWKDVNLSFSDLKGTRFQKSRFERVNFERADLQNSVFILSELSHCRLNGADLSQAKIYLTSFENSTFDQATRLPFSKEEALGRGMIFEQ